MRSLPSPMITAITSNQVSPVILLDLTLKSGTVHVWSGLGTVTANGNSYQGVGNLGSIGDIHEGVEVKADGTTVTLSGIDPALLNDCLTDIQLGAPATIWLGLFANGAVTTTYPLFVGTVDRPTVPINPDSISITLALENRMLNLQRPTNRRYTSADQRYTHPDDSGFAWVESLNDQALIWG